MQSFKEQNPVILVLSFHPSALTPSPQNALLERVKEKSDPENILKIHENWQGFSWRLHSKYFQADLDWLSLNICDETIRDDTVCDFIEAELKKTESGEPRRVEAIVFYLGQNCIKNVSLK